MSGIGARRLASQIPPSFQFLHFSRVFRRLFSTNVLFVAEAALALYQRDIVLGTDAVQKWYGRCWPSPTDTAIDVRNHVTFLEHSATSPDYLEDIVRVNNLLGSFVPVSGTSHCIRATSVLEQEVALRLSQYVDGAHVVVITSPPSEAMEVLLDQGSFAGRLASAR